MAAHLVALRSKELAKEYLEDACTIISNKAKGDDAK